MAAAKAYEIGEKVVKLGQALFKIGRAIINVGAKEEAEGVAGKSSFLSRGATTAAGVLGTGEALGAGATVGVLATAGAMYKPAEVKALERMGIAADAATEALNGFPTAVHSLTDKIPVVGAALGQLVSAAIAVAGQIAMIPAAPPSNLLSPVAEKLGP